MTKSGGKNETWWNKDWACKFFKWNNWGATTSKLPTWPSKLFCKVRALLSVCVANFLYKTFFPLESKGTNFLLFSSTSCPNKQVCKVTEFLTNFWKRDRIWPRRSTVLLRREKARQDLKSKAKKHNGKMNILPQKEAKGDHALQSRCPYTLLLKGQLTSSTPALTQVRNLAHQDWDFESNRRKTSKTKSRAVVVCSLTNPEWCVCFHHCWGRFISPWPKLSPYRHFGLWRLS